MTEESFVTFKYFYGTENALRVKKTLEEYPDTWEEFLMKVKEENESEKTKEDN